MQTAIEKIQQAMSRGIVLFDEYGELYQINSVAAGILWNENSNDEIYDELIEAARMMSVSEQKEADTRKMRFDADDFEVLCSLRKISSNRYRAILKIGDELPVAVA